MKIILMLLISYICLEGLTIAQEAEVPIYLKDRGTGIPTSMFGTYVSKGELLFYPFSSTTMIMILNTALLS
jgi:hypothetical protein